MQFISRIIVRNPSSAYCSSTSILSKNFFSNLKLFRNARVFSSEFDSDKENQHHYQWNTEVGGGGGGGGGGSSSSSSAPFAWDDSVSSWSTGLTKDHFDGKALGRQVSQGEDDGVGVGGGVGGGGDDEWKSEPPVASEDVLERAVRERLEELMREAEASRLGNDDDEMDEETMRENLKLYRQITEPGARGAYLKDSEKAEMYRLHKENSQVYTVERLAKEFRIMRQRVVAILWLKELEEEEEKKRGEPLDDSVELLIDTFPE